MFGFLSAHLVLSGERGQGRGSGPGTRDRAAGAEAPGPTGDTPRRQETARETGRPRAED